MLKVVHEESDSNEASGSGSSSLLDEIVRDGARQMLTAALQAEVVAYVEATRRSSTSTVVGWWSATATTTPGR